MDNKIAYINFCITHFAKRLRISPLLSYRYLSTYSGLQFLDQCYEAEHLLSIDDAVDDLRKVCRNNGGTL